MKSVAGSIVHAFLWVSLWLFLTAKNSWVFQLKISIGKTMLNSPSCLATCAQLELNSDGRKQLEVLYIHMIEKKNNFCIRSNIVLFFKLGIRELARKHRFCQPHAVACKWKSVQHFGYPNSKQYQRSYPRQNKSSRKRQRN